ncbi:MAG: 50S ribosomal protein L25 [Candidatus Stahlbacteria bacterium]|nr:MAG: 50S ribosomal protein L25 [Candidatus Stahlbacteria bacterium]
MKIEVMKRKEVGSNRVKKIRREGWIPGVIYGHGEKSYHIKLRDDDLIKLIHELHSEATLITLNFEGKELQSIIREVTRDPLTEKLLHVDFQHIHEDEEVTVHVIVEIKGESLGVKDGGILNVEHRYLTVRCLPKDMPEEIVIDISNLQIGDSYHVSDIELPLNVKIEEDQTATMVNVLSPRKIVEVKPVEEELLAEGVEEPELISEEEAEAKEAEESKEKKEETEE